nr:amidophosphoribosyltransferase [Candidatus Sigynarchaeota archaeon]
MGGIFGVVSRGDCVQDLFYGTDYHSHLGTYRGGLACLNSAGFNRSIHDITNSQFRSKFEDDIQKMHGHKGVGVISDTDDQPLLIGSRLGTFAIVTVARINNINQLAEDLFKQGAHFSEMNGDNINPTEMIAKLVCQGETFAAGIKNAQDKVDGLCQILLLTKDGIYAARDKYGRIPLIIGEKSGTHAVTVETCAFLNLGIETTRDLGPGEIVFISEDGVEQLQPPNDKLQICAFMWVYYGYPASNYEGINVEVVRNRCGACLARKEKIPLDLVTGIPDSGTGHGIGYANEAKVPYARPFVKYTPTWPRSFMPQDQVQRNLVARMKLMPIKEFIEDKRMLFCEDSIVRGTQLRDTIQQLYKLGAKEVHMRPACPPLVYGCKFLNFSRSKSDLDLATRQAIKELGGDGTGLKEFADPDSEKYKIMIESIRKQLHLTTLKYQRLDDLVEAIGLPKEKLCTYCWDGVE